MSQETALIAIWTGFLLLGVTAASAVFVWAIRTGQFGDQEHARSLPLRAGIPRKEEDDASGGGGS